MNTPEFNLYDGKSYNDLFKDIIKNSENKRDQIDLIVSELRDQIKTKGDAVVIGPQIQSYMDISVKNDEQLIKLAAIIQRLITAQTTEDTSAGISLTDEERANLMKEAVKIQNETKTTVDQDMNPTEPKQ